MHLIPTILSGGSGSRLWPVSRELHPKPFIRLADGQSLLQKAFLRGAELPDVEHIVTVTNRELLFKIKDDYNEVNQQGVKTSFILEPFGRNTAPAIASAALKIAELYGDDAFMLVLAADHLINDKENFSQAVSEAIELAKNNQIVTFGIRPDKPETGYGYIENQGNQVLRFVEKPSFERAVEYLQSGTYLWNSGMFCFQVGALIAQMEQHCPHILHPTKACVVGSSVMSGKDGIQVELDEVLFKNIPEDSIDYALMEQSKQIAVVPCDIGWSDIGSWKAVADLYSTDENSNYIEGDVLAHQVRNCLIQSESRVVGAVGIQNLLVIDTPDALLVADKAYAQEVKHIYNELKAKQHNAYKYHQTVVRPWGTYSVLEEGSNFKIKRIEVKPGASLSLQMHFHRSEHWVVVQGSALVTNGEEKMIVRVNESTYIPVGNKHRLENQTDELLVIIEVQSGQYVGEDDIVRFEDVYGRIQELAK